MDRQEAIQQLTVLEKHFGAYEEEFRLMQREKDLLIVLEDQQRRSSKTPKRFFWLLFVAITLLLELLLSPLINGIATNLQQDFSMAKLSVLVLCLVVVMLAIFSLTKVLIGVIDRKKLKNRETVFQEITRVQEEKVQPILAKLQGVYDEVTAQLGTAPVLPLEDCAPGVIRGVLSMFELDDADTVEEALDYIHRKGAVEQQGRLSKLRLEIGAPTGGRAK